MLPWNEDGSVWEGADMWALAGESREYLVDLYRSVVGAHRRLHRGAAARRPRHGGLVAGRAPRDDVRAPARALRGRDGAARRATPTSCARGSTGRAGATTTTWATRPPGPRTWRGSSRRPTSTARYVGAQRPMSATTASRDSHQVGGGQAEVEPAPTPGHVDDVEQLGALVDDRRECALLADGRDSADDVARGPLRRSGIRHGHPLGSECRSHRLQVELARHRHDRDGEAGSGVDEQGLEDLLRR